MSENQNLEKRLNDCFVLICRVLMANMEGERVSRDAGMEAFQAFSSLFGIGPYQGSGLIQALQTEQVEAERERNLEMVSRCVKVYNREESEHKRPYAGEKATACEYVHWCIESWDWEKQKPNMPLAF